MVRTLGSTNIKSWNKTRLIKKLADMGDTTYEDLAEEFDVPVDTIYQFNYRNKAAIRAVQEGREEQFEHLWAVNKENRLTLIIARVEELQERLDELVREATRQSEEMSRNFGDEAAPVLVNGPEWRAYSREQTKLLDQIADETGQKPNRQPPEPARGPALRTVVEGVDLNQAFFGAPASEAAEVLR